LHVFPQVSNAFAALYPLEHALFKVPRGDDSVAVEEEDFRRPGYGLDFVLSLKIGQLSDMSAEIIGRRCTLT
jgi:hypothetical protein